MSRLIPLHTLTLLAAACAAGTAQAAGNSRAPQSLAEFQNLESRARAHLTAFAGHTLAAADHAFDVHDAMVDDDGSQHVRFKRSFRGMPVIGGDLVVHSDAQGAFRSATKSMERSINVAKTASVSAGRAIVAALGAHSGTTRGEAPQAVVYARGDLPTLAWDVRVYSASADGLPSEKHVIVDATTGAVLEAWDDIHTTAASGTEIGRAHV